MLTGSVNRAVEEGGVNCEWAGHLGGGIRPESLHVKFGGLIGAAGTHFGAATVATANVTGFFVEFTFAHFLFDAGMFDKFPEPTHRFIHTFVITQTQLNHKNPPVPNGKLGVDGNSGNQHSTKLAAKCKYPTARNRRYTTNPGNGETSRAAVLFSARDSAESQAINQAPRGNCARKPAESAA